MSRRKKIILDTDPGIDDILAILLALSASSEELEVLLISLTYGNVEVHKCLRNIAHLFHHVQREIRWRRDKGLPLGFESMLSKKPMVAIGADKPLADDILMADYFHGYDGMANTLDSHPHLSPDEAWKKLFNSSAQDHLALEQAEEETLYQPSHRPAHEEIIRLLAEHDEDEITIVAVGPMTNTALAAASDTKTFLKVKEVVVMGGTIGEPGNITPVAEFNTIADCYAAARVYALTSPRPVTTMPPVPPKKYGNAGNAPPPFLSPYPEGLKRRLTLTLVPLDITSEHLLVKEEFERTVGPLKKAGSPLAFWVDALVSSTYKKIESLRDHADDALTGLQLHDPLCVWYCIRSVLDGWRLNIDEDIRVETSGQWTRGMCVVDRRRRRKRPAGDERDDIPGDTGNWLSESAGNRMQRLVDTPDRSRFGTELLRRIFATIDDAKA